MFELTLASESAVKLNAVKSAVLLTRWDVKTHAVHTTLPAQPYGKTMIEDCASVRLREVRAPYAIAIESGVVDNPQKNNVNEISVVLLRTPLGVFQVWTEPFPHDEEIHSQWRQLEHALRHKNDLTLGSLYAKKYGVNANDWYKAVHTDSRVQVLAVAVRLAYEQCVAAHRGLVPVKPCTVKPFKGVSAFYDVQSVFAQGDGGQLGRNMQLLANRLLFDTVVLMESRGYLFASLFGQYRTVFARKPGKSPNEEWSVEYAKEYGTDQLCLDKDVIRPGARVLVVDDVVATGGTFLAAEQLVSRAGGEVVGFLAAFAVANEQQELLAEPMLLSRLRFTNHIQDVVPTSRWTSTDTPALIVPPSLLGAVPKLGLLGDLLPMTWDRFAHCPNVKFRADELRGRTCFVFVDTSNDAETLVLLQLLHIVHRKDPRRVYVVIPHLEQATQDRVERDLTGMETLALSDTLAKAIGAFTVLTFDLHAEQTRFAFHDLREASLVAALWNKYRRQFPDCAVAFPDAGAAKRYRNLPGLQERPIVVFSKQREGDRRVLTTLDEVHSQRYVVMDDLVRSGNTMAEAARYLRDHGALHVTALFAHAAFEPDSARNMREFHEVWTSDSRPRLVPPEFVQVHVQDMLTFDLWRFK